MTAAGVWSNRNFRRYWAAHTISLTGDQVSAIAILLVAVTMLHASSAQMGVLTALGQLPLLCFGLLAGVWADRTSRRRLLVACDLGRAAVIALVPIGALVGFLGMPLLMVVGFTSATLGVLFGTAAVALLPDLVDRDQLISGHARLTQARAVVQVAGPGLGGALVQALTAPVAIVLDALSYVGSAMLLRRISVVDRAVDAENEERTSIRTAILQGLSLVWRNPILRVSAATAGTYNLFNSAVLAVQVLYLARILRFEPAEIGVLLAASGPGALLGAALAVPISRRFGVGPTMIAGVFTAGLAVLVVPLAGGSHLVVLGTLLVAMFVNGFGQPLYNINQSGLRQAVVPAERQGRVQATLSVLAGAAAPVGALGGGLLGQWCGTRVALVVAGTGTAAACTWLYRSPVRRLIVLPTDSSRLSNGSLM